MVSERPRLPRPLGRRSAGVALLWVWGVAVSSLGCQRGCLTQAVEDQRREIREKRIDFGGTDCPGGLLRCRDGRLERSLTSHLPASCDRGEACTCPYAAAGECERGCLVEDMPTALDEGAESALCVSLGPRSLPVLAPAPDGVCDSDDVRCVNGALVRCVPSPRTVAQCLRGCSGRGTLDSDVDDQALTALCRP